MAIITTQISSMKAHEQRMMRVLPVSVLCFPALDTFSLTTFFVAAEALFCNADNQVGIGTARVFEPAAGYVL
jgi:hypothetical protein